MYVNVAVQEYQSNTMTVFIGNLIFSITINQNPIAANHAKDIHSRKVRKEVDLANSISANLFSIYI